MRFKVVVERTLVFEREYTVDAKTETAAKDAAREKDEQADLLSGKWTNKFVKATVK